jgi:hypothetical protein
VVKEKKSWNRKQHRQKHEKQNIKKRQKYKRMTRKNANNKKTTRGSIAKNEMRSNPTRNRQEREYQEKMNPKQKRRRNIGSKTGTKLYMKYIISLRRRIIFSCFRDETIKNSVGLLVAC